MNAVNLLPPDLRRGSAAPSRSGVAVYVVLGVLAAAVMLVAATTLVKGRVADRETQLAQAEAEAQQAELQAASIAHYKQLASQTSSRVNGVKSVAAGRVYWAPALTQISETVGTKIAFASLNASASATSGSSGGSTLRSTLDAPALEVTGCAENHPAVARLMTRFRAMNDVQRVSLASSTKEVAGGGTDAGGSGGGAECTAGGKLPAKFTLVIWLTSDAVAKTATTTTTGGTK